MEGRWVFRTSQSEGLCFCALVVSFMETCFCGLLILFIYFLFPEHGQACSEFALVLKTSVIGLIAA